MEDFLTFFILGMLGGDIANNLSKNNKPIKISIRFLALFFLLIFTLTYICGLIIFLLGYFLNNFPILWNKLGQFCLIISFITVLVVFVIDKFKQKK